jgi:hypothetical protein
MHNDTPVFKRDSPQCISKNEFQAIYAVAVIEKMCLFK